MSSIVSSARLDRVAAAYGAHRETTLTGFKWIWEAGRHLVAGGHAFVLGYEEALGYCVGDVVRDKDGIAAAVVLADLVAHLAARGETVADRLHALDERFGPWANVQRSAWRPGPEGIAEIRRAVQRAATAAAPRLGPYPVERVEDLRRGAADRPSWLPAATVVVWHLAGGGRVLVRPSGTEPKLKLYVDLPLDGDDRPHVADEVAAAAIEVLGLT